MNHKEIVIKFGTACKLGSDVLHKQLPVLASGKAARMQYNANS